MGIVVGEKAEAEFRVALADTAQVLSLDSLDTFPPVFATSRMIALMELAAARVLRPLLQAGEMSVGVGVEARHTAATPVGSRVHAEATYSGREGKLYAFEVVAYDEAGIIGTCKHTRAIISAERLMQGAAKRRPSENRSA